MEQLSTWVNQASQGDSQAYENIVHCFQDMAVGYAYTLLNNWQEAEDTAQESFITAYYSLNKLRNHAAFPGWFRRIVYTQANRRLRVKQPIMLAFDQVADVAPTDPAHMLEKQEAQDELNNVLQSLPDHQRSVIVLYYMNDYSQKEIATFLEIPIGTVKTRLHHARKQLKMRISTLNDLSSQRPSQDNQFTEKVMRLFEETKNGNVEQVKKLLAQNTSLAQASGFIQTALWGSDAPALHVAVMHGRKDIIDVLLAHGADINIRDEKYHFTALIHAIDLADFMPQYAELGMIDFLLERGAIKDVWASWWLGDMETVKGWLDSDPSLVNQIGPGPSTLLSFCTEIKAIKFLLDYGANPLQVYKRSGWAGEMTPLRDLAYRGNYEGVRYLLEHLGTSVDLYFASIMGDLETVKKLVQAQPDLVNIPAPSDHALGTHIRPLHLAVQGGHRDLVTWLLQHGADINARSIHNFTALHMAICFGERELYDPMPDLAQLAQGVGVYHMLTEIPQLLIDNGADIMARSSENNLTPLGLALSDFEDETDRKEVITLLKSAGATQ